MSLIESNDNVKYGSRNGFVSFWLGLMVAANGIIAVKTFWGLINNFSVVSLFSAICSAVACAAAVMILNWKKLGFWLFVIISFVIAAINIYEVCSNPLMALYYGNYKTIIIVVLLLIPVLSSVILWAILQIRKYGVSCWKQLK